MKAALELAIHKMQLDGASSQAIRAFSNSFELAASGYDGLIPEKTIQPLEEAQHVEDLPTASGRTAFHATALVKLNGGLGTSMGISRAKSTLPVKNGLTFLDFCARQILAVRARSGASLPVTFMNSYHTSSDTLEILNRYPRLRTGNIPIEILQGRIPKLDAQTMEPVTAAQPQLEWCPAGHGELLALLESTGLREGLQKAGYRYLFVSNSDNLGAVPDARIPEWMAAHSIPMVMEVCRRTLSDMKGGHVARRRDTGRLILRDSNMVVEGEDETYEDISTHRYFNTNCLWFDLGALSTAVSDSGGVNLPVIVNRKTLDPADDHSIQVLQLETGMGTSVGAFAGAEVIEVPREKFVPVKSSNHMLVVRSDFFTYSSDSYRFHPARSDWPLVNLDPRYYRVLSECDLRFPFGPPSLVECSSLTVHGDVTFGRSVRCVGDVIVEVESRTVIADETRLVGRLSHIIPESDNTKDQ